MRQGREGKTGVSYAQPPFFLRHDLGSYFNRQSAGFRVGHLLRLVDTVPKDELMNIPHTSCLG
jgi:hypothetical protein